MAKPEIQPIKFVTVERVFPHEIKVRARSDVSGWVDRGKKSGKPVKWSIGAGRVAYLDHKTAREFIAKGFVDLVEGEITPLSEQELAELRAEVTRVSLEAPRG
jgi:hypothetical protein